MKILPVGAELFHADGQTDRHERANSSFSRILLTGRKKKKKKRLLTLLTMLESRMGLTFNPLNAELNPIRHLLASVGAHHFVDVSRIKG
jgi:hypothetical protein